MKNRCSETGIYLLLWEYLRKLIINPPTGKKMGYQVNRAEYFRTTVKDEPGEAYKVLSRLVEIGINLMAFTAVPIGFDQTQLTMFPQSKVNMVNKAKLAGLELEGPFTAFLVQGDDELGALADIHVKLYDADINITASSGVADGKGSFGYVIYVRKDDFEKAGKILGI
jgi:hypothetical protein